jgi:uncharacterized protein
MAASRGPVGGLSGTGVDTVVEVLAVLAAITAGAVVQGCIGFGGNLVAVPVVALVDPGLVPGPMLVQVLALTLLMVRDERDHMDRPAVGWALVGRVPGAVVGAWALRTLDGDGIGVLFGAAILTAVLISASGWILPRTPRTLVGAGAVSGFTGTTTSVGGPPIALVFQRDSGPVIRSSLSAFFIAGTLITIAVLVVAGEFAGGDLAMGIALLPATVVGYLVSGRFRTVLDRGWTRPALLALSAVSATVLLLRSLL